MNTVTIILIVIAAIVVPVAVFALAIMRGSAQEQQAYDQAYANYEAERKRKSGLNVP